MSLEEVKELLLTNIPSGHRQDDVHQLFLAAGWLPVIDAQERNRCVRTGALVAIQERVILGDVEEVCGCHRRMVGWR